MNEKFKAFIKRDFIYIIVLLLALLACLLTIQGTDNYQDQCNQHWQQQLQTKCLCTNITKWNEQFAPTLMNPLT